MMPVIIANRQQQVSVLNLFHFTFHCESLFLELQDQNPAETEEENLGVHRFHGTNASPVAQVKKEWVIVKHVGRGLNNKTRQGFCQNICYMNSIIQSLAVSALFVQWLFAEDFAVKCE